MNNQPPDDDDENDQQHAAPAQSAEAPETKAIRQDPQGPQGQAEDDSVARLVSASFAEDDEDEAGGLLQLPDALQDSQGQPLDAAQLAAALDDPDEESSNWSEALEQGQAAAAASALAAAEDADASESPQESAEPAASWSSDADSTPLMDEDGDEELLRAEINQRIAGMDPSAEDLLAVPETIDLPPTEVRAAVEALLLVSNRPLSLKRLCDCLPGTQEPYIAGLLAGLAERYRHEHRGWDLRQLAGGWQLLTRPELHPWVRQLDKQELPTRLSKSAMETLAIVAYKQPVGRGAIEDIRGVQCGPMLRQLMDLKLVQVVGRNDDAVGRPLLYGTTAIFLDRFGLGSTADLPRRHEFG